MKKIIFGSFCFDWNFWSFQFRWYISYPLGSMSRSKVVQPIYWDQGNAKVIHSWVIAKQNKLRNWPDYQSIATFFCPRVMITKRNTLEVWPEYQSIATYMWAQHKHKQFNPFNPRQCQESLSSSDNVTKLSCIYHSLF